MRIAVVGASVAGVAACEAVRAAGFEGDLELIGAEDHAPYDRPPLSKQLLLGVQQPADIVLRPPEELAALGLRERRGRAAEGLDVPARELVLAGGERIGFDGLVIATGSQARRLRGQPEIPGVHLLRTLEDALAVRAGLGDARRVVIVGAGFIGLEAASCALEMGIEAVVLETAPEPMGRLLPARVGRLFAALHRGRGVDVRCGVQVTGIEAADEAVRGVRLASGELLDADLVLIGVGAAPCTQWLAGSGLTVEDGVRCDAALRAGPGIYAAGDVARWPHPLFGDLRVEHWSTANDHGRTAGTNLVHELAGAAADERAVSSEVPYFWSDQLGHKIQLTGWSPSATRTAIAVDRGRVLALLGQGDRLVAALGVDAVKSLALHRRKIATGVSFDEAVAAAPGEPVEPEELTAAFEAGWGGIHAPAPRGGAA